MGLEHFYWFVDREVLDPILEMSWKEFLLRYRWRRGSLEELLSTVVEPEPDPAAVDRIIAQRPLRWTMQHAAPAYYLLNEIVHRIPSSKKKCPEVWASDPCEVAVLEAAAASAFLQGRIDDATFWAVNNINGRDDPRAWCRLDRSAEQSLLAALDRGLSEKPIFPWLNERCLDEGYRCLGLAQTKRFTGFLLRAWDENWPVPFLKKEIRQTLGVEHTTRPGFRDFELPRQLVECIRTCRLDKSCAISFFG